MASASVRRALVTGGNRGIGKAVCAELRSRGYEVLLTARSLDDARAAAAETGCTALRLDVTSQSSVDSCAAEAGPVDVLVPNAGILLDRGASAATVPLADVARTWEVNVLGAWRVCQAFVPGMAERGWGRVVFVSSGTGCFANGLAPAIPAYSMSKTSLNALTVLLAAAHRADGVLVNAVNPGTTRTDMMPKGQRLPEEAAADIADAAALPDDGPSGCLLRGSEVLAW